MDRGDCPWSHIELAMTEQLVKSKAVFLMDRGVPRGHSEMLALARGPHPTHSIGQDSVTKGRLGSHGPCPGPGGTVCVCVCVCVCVSGVGEADICCFFSFYHLGGGEGSWGQLGMLRKQKLLSRF